MARNLTFVRSKDWIASVYELTEAIAMMFAAFYIFNMEFPKLLRSTFTYIKNNVFQVNDDITRKDEKLTKLNYNYLNDIFCCIKLLYIF